jgi:glutathione S-transferase
MNHGLDIALSLSASLAEAGRGVKVRSTTAGPPALLLELYDIENCPYCRLVREALTELDLDAIIYPCPKGGVRFRQKAQELGGKQQFPFLVDPNTGAQMYESANILAYLSATYGDGRMPGRLGRAFIAAGSLGVSALRIGRGQRTAEGGELPAKPLELYSFETSPFARIVRERLCELEIPYILRNCGRRQGLDWLPIPPLRKKLAPDYAPVQRNRKALSDGPGTVQVPYLIDPNTSVSMYESGDILAYLDRTYG